MQLSQLSKNIVHLLLNPAKGLEVLYLFYVDLLEKSKSELEFIARHRNETKNRFLGYSYSDVELLQDEFDVQNFDYERFREIIQKFEDNLKLFEPQVSNGNFKSFKNGMEYNFIYTYYTDYILAFKGESLVFNITTHDSANMNGFSFQLKIMPNGKDLKVVDMYHDEKNKSTFGKGVSVAIIQHVTKKIKKRIISSTNINAYKCHSGESNSQEAIDKVWEKMREIGDVGYNEIEGYYYTK